MRGGKLNRWSEAAIYYDRDDGFRCMVPPLHGEQNEA